MKPIISAALFVFAAQFGWAQESTEPATTAETETESEAEPAGTLIRILSYVTVDDLSYLLEDMQAEFVAAGRNATGAPFVFGEMADGATFGIYTICAAPDGTDCRGVEFMAVLGSDVSAEEVSQIDRDFPAISVYKVDADTVHLSRYVILDHGITWPNLVENGLVFNVLCGKVLERLSMKPPEPVPGQSQEVTR